MYPSGKRGEAFRVQLRRDLSVRICKDHNKREKCGGCRKHQTQALRDWKIQSRYR